MKIFFSSKSKFNSTQHNGSDISVFPNPSNGLINFDGTGTSRIQSIQIMNLLGEKIYHSGIFNSTIDLSDQPVGVYFVNIFMPGKTVTEKIVLAK